MKFFGILFLIFSIFHTVSADFTSTNFELENPTNFTGGGESSSTSFKYVSSTGQTVQGTGESISFQEQASSLYFPTITSVSQAGNVGGSGGGGNVSLPGLDLICRIADFNCDTYVDILDLSILLYYIQNPTLFQSVHDLNQDSFIDLADISILFYYWDI